MDVHLKAYHFQKSLKKLLIEVGLRACGLYGNAEFLRRDSPVLHRDCSSHVLFSEIGGGLIAGNVELRPGAVLSIAAE
jgi:hypothetical protein